MATRLKNGKYRATLLLPNGKTKAFIGNTKREAEEKKLKYQTFEMGKNNSGYDMTLGDLINFWLYDYIYKRVVDENSIKRSTFDTYESTFKSCIKNTDISFIRLSDLDTNKVSIMKFDEHIIEITKNKSYSSGKKVYAQLYNALDYAYKRGLINNDIKGKISKPKKGVNPPKNIKTYTANEFNLLMDTANNLYNKNGYYRNGLAYLILYYTGIRMGELLALTIHDIDFKNKSITINKAIKEIAERDTTDNSKILKWTTETQTLKTNNSYRTLAINDNCIIAIRELIKRQQEKNIISQYLVCNNQGEHETPNQFKKSWSSLCNRCGVENKGIHAIRHTFATNNLINNNPIELVSKYLGHSDYNITSHTYSHINRNVISLNNAM